MTIRHKARFLMPSLAIMATATLTATLGAMPAKASESLHSKADILADLSAPAQLQQSTTTSERLPDGTIVTTTTTTPRYDPSIYRSDSRVVYQGVPAPDPNMPVVTQGGTYDGQWSGNYASPDGRVYQGRWAGTYQDDQGQVLQSEYNGTYVGDSRYTDINGNPVGVDFGTNGAPVAPIGRLPGPVAPGFRPVQPTPGVAFGRSREELLARCRRENRDNGVGGALIGGGLGALAGNRIAGRGNRTAGTLIGAGAGALAGAIIDKSESDGCDQIVDQQLAQQQQQQQQGSYYPQGYYPQGYYYPQYYYPQQTVTVVVVPGSSTTTTTTTVVEEDVYHTSRPTKRVIRKGKRLRR